MVADVSAITPAPASRGLLRILGLAFGVAVVVGGMVGTGILRTPGPVAGMLESAGLIYLVWLVAGIYALTATNVYAELATSVPLGRWRDCRSRATTAVDGHPVPGSVAARLWATK